MPSGFFGGGIGPRAFAGGGLPNPVPVAGAELLTNGDFTAGATGWTVDAGYYTFADGKVQRDVAVGSGYIVQGVAQANKWYTLQVDLERMDSGSLTMRIGNTFPTATAGTGTKLVTGWANATSLGFSLPNGSNGILDNASGKLLDLASLLSTRVYASPDCDLSAAATRTSGTQVGLVARLDSHTSPANFIVAYLDGGGNVKTDKCVGGTYSNLAGASGAITYAAGATLRLVCTGTSVTVYYNGALIGTAEVTDAGIVSNVRHGKFSTYAANTLTAFTNRVGEWITSETDPVPTLGAELLTNGGFETDTVWAKGTGWTIPGDGTAVHDTSVGGYITQNVLTTGVWTRVGVNLISTTDLATTVARVGSVYPALISTGANVITQRATSATAGFGTGAATAIVIDDASFKPLALSSLLSTRAYGSADCDLSAAVTFTAGTQVGLVARLDSATSPQNFIIAYLDGAGNVKLDKAVAGAYTAVLTGAVTYTAGKVLRLVCSGNDVSVYYDGTQVGTTQTVSDAGITGNLRHGKFSTYAANTFTGFVAA